MAGWAQGCGGRWAALGLRKASGKQMGGFRAPLHTHAHTRTPAAGWGGVGWSGVWGRVGWAGEPGSEPSRGGQSPEALWRVAGKMVILREARSWIPRATPRGGPGRAGRQGDRDGARREVPPSFPGRGGEAGGARAAGESYHQIG